MVIADLGGCEGWRLRGALVCGASYGRHGRGVILIAGGGHDTIRISDARHRDRGTRYGVAKGLAAVGVGRDYRHSPEARRSGV